MPVFGSKHDSEEKKSPLSSPACSWMRHTLGHFFATDVPYQVGSGGSLGFFFLNSAGASDQVGGSASASSASPQSNQTARSFSCVPITRIALPPKMLNGAVLNSSTFFSEIGLPFTCTASSIAGRPPTLVRAVSTSST